MTTTKRRIDIIVGENENEYEGDLASHQRSIGEVVTYALEPSAPLDDGGRNQAVWLLPIDVQPLTAFDRRDWETLADLVIEGTAS